MLQVKWPKYAKARQPRSLVDRSDSSTSLPILNDTTASIPTAPIVKPSKSNIFASLTNDEAASVISFLHNQTELNLTANADAGEWDNAITVLDLIAPNKSIALSYLDGDAEEPARYAKAVVMFGASEVSLVTYTCLEREGEAGIYLISFSF